MDRKKIIGLIVFTILISLVIGYTWIGEVYAAGRSKSLMANGEYVEAYKLLRDKTFKESSDGYYNALICEFELGRHIYFNRRFNQLISNKNTVVIQRMVNELGIRLEDRLVAIYEMGGVIFDVEASYYIANLYYEEYVRFGDISNLNLAKDIRGQRDEVDKIYLAYYFSRGDFELLTPKYLGLSEDLRVEFKSLMREELVSKRLNNEIFNDDAVVSIRVNEVSKYLDYVDSLSLDMELAEWIGVEIFKSLRYYYVNSGKGELLSQVLDHPFLSDNHNVRLTELLGEFERTTHKDKVIKEIKGVLEKEDYLPIEGMHELAMGIVNGNQIYYNSIVTSSGVIITANMQGYQKYYDLNTYKEIKLSDGYIIEMQDGFSLGKSYFLGRKFIGKGPDNIKVENAIFDGKLNKIHEFGQNFVLYSWIDDKRMLFSETGGVGELKVFDASTRDITDYEEGSIEPIVLRPSINLSTVLSIQGETYSASEWLGNSNYYVVRKVSDNEEVVRLELKYVFVGEDANYVYGFDFVDNRMVLVSVNKSTLQKSILPFLIDETGTGPQW